MSTRNENIEARSENPKKREENSCTDSGFHSGFQDSSEILSGEVDAADNETGSRQQELKGISQPSDDKIDDDSGMISNNYVVKEQVYVPSFLSSPYSRQHHPSIDKYFDQDEDGYTKLHIAILHHMEPAISALLQLVPDSSYLNIRNFCGQTALHLAVLLGQQATVKKLINAGADVNVRDNRCNTALHLACLNDDLSCVHIITSAVYPQNEKKLLANLEQWNYDGETCFFIASKAKNIAIMRALALNGANVNAREGRSGYTSLHLAVETNASDVLKFLCEECSTLSLDTENYGGITAFQLSLLTNQENVANYLLAKGATPYFTSEDSDSDMEDDASDLSGDELEKNQIITKIAGIAVN